MQGGIGISWTAEEEMTDNGRCGQGIVMMA